MHCRLVRTDQLKTAKAENFPVGNRQEPQLRSVTYHSVADRPKGNTGTDRKNAGHI
jgi:hypothetical protein